MRVKLKIFHSNQSRSFHQFLFPIYCNMDSTILILKEQIIDFLNFYYKTQLYQKNSNTIKNLSNIDIDGYELQDEFVIEDLIKDNEIIKY